MSFGEGPLFNRRDNTFFWVDIVGDTIFRWTPGRGAQPFIRPSGKANGLTFDREGRLCVAGWASRTVWRGGGGGRGPGPPPPTQGGKKKKPPNNRVGAARRTHYLTPPLGPVT